MRTDTPYRPHLHMPYGILLKPVMMLCSRRFRLPSLPSVSCLAAFKLLLLYVHLHYKLEFLIKICVFRLLA